MRLGSNGSVFQGYLQGLGLRGSCPGGGTTPRRPRHERAEGAALPGMTPPQRPGSAHPAGTSLQTCPGPALPPWAAAPQTGAGGACCKAVGETAADVRAHALCPGASVRTAHVQAGAGNPPLGKPLQEKRALYNTPVHYAWGSDSAEDEVSADGPKPPPPPPPRAGEKAWSLIFAFLPLAFLVSARSMMEGSTLNARWTLSCRHSATCPKP